LIGVANAPVSYGAFELTVGILPNVPGPDEVLAAIAAAGYSGTELGPRGYLGANGAELSARLAAHGLALAGAFVELRFGDGDGDFAELEATLDLIAGLGAKPLLSDAGPRDGDVDLEGVRRATDLARSRGYEPTFHHHMGTRVQTVAEIERLLDGTDVGLLLDTGHLTAAGGDPVAALRDWRPRIDHLHLKDVSLGVLRASTSWDEAWRRGAFCELGTGDADLIGFLAELAGYDGWLVVEQDWVPAPGEDPAAQIAAQERNRRWLAEHVAL
jgi:inosose dehydratase